MKEEILSLCSSLDDDEFNRVVRRACHGTTKLPTAADYLKHARPIIKQKREKAQKEKLARLDDAPCKCAWCGNYGILYAVKRQTAYEYAFQCHRCANATMRGTAGGYPRWDEEIHGQEFELRPVNPARIAAYAAGVDAP